MTRLCEKCPLSTAVKVYLPGLKLDRESEIWNSVSTAVTAVPAAGAGADEAAALLSGVALDGAAE
jgi:hypothetical protein